MMYIYITSFMILTSVSKGIVLHIAIHGREAAYTGKAISWDEIMSSPLRYGPETYAMGPLPFYREGEAPLPGRAPEASVM